MLGFLAITLALAGDPDQSPERSFPVCFWVDVSHALSGDRVVATVVHSMDYNWYVGREIVIRLHGVMAPRKGQPQYKESIAHLEKLLISDRASVEYYGFLQDAGNVFHGRLVRVDGGAGQFGFGGDGELDAAEWQLRHGMAWWDYRKSDDVFHAKSERLAFENRRGIWQEDRPMEPWIYKEMQDAKAD